MRVCVRARACVCVWVQSGINIQKQVFKLSSVLIIREAAPVLLDGSILSFSALKEPKHHVTALFPDKPPT